jgi:hypothetical protein
MFYKHDEHLEWTTSRAPKMKGATNGSREKRSTFSHLVHTSNLMSHLKPINNMYLSNKYMDHGDRSSNDEYYLPCIAMYLFLKYYNLCGNNFLMNKSYVYSWSNTDEFSQN